MVRVTKRNGSSGFDLVEFSGGNSGNGGLIEFHQDESGTVHVTLYRLDKKVRVKINRPR